MPQQKITRYFHPTQPRGPAPKITFLNLPYELRRRVYLEAGLVSELVIYLNLDCSEGFPCPQRGDPIDPDDWPLEPVQRPVDEDEIPPKSKSLSYFLDGPMPRPETQLSRYCPCDDERDMRGERRHACTCDPFPWQLLYTSQTIADEVFSIFYAENHFAVSRLCHAGFSPLILLPPKAISCMTSLWICLNFDFDKHDWNIPYCPESCNCLLVGGFDGRKSVRQETSRLPRRFDILSEWQRLWQFLSKEIQPDHLRLTVTCDVADLKAARQYVEPLLLLPKLRDCAIRLAENPSTTWCTPIQQVARQTAEKLCGQPATHDSFRYMDLPKEIQLQILEYTDLVSPLDLAWLANRNKKYLHSPFNPFYQNQLWIPDTANPNPPGQLVCCGECSVLSGACSCWSRFAAFSTTCRCWRMPHSLFLVCHQITENAEKIFYSKNHFVIDALSNKRQLSIYNFLARIPRVRQYLRFVTWRVRTLKVGQHFDPVRGSELYNSWLGAIDFITRDVIISQFSLTIDLDYGLAQASALRWLLAHRDQMWRIGLVCAQSLAHFRFKCVFFHFKLLNVLVEADPVEDRGVLLEKMVMGEDYDSTAMGKYERRHLWNGYECEPTCKCWE